MALTIQDIALLTAIHEIIIDGDLNNLTSRMIKQQLKNTYDYVDMNKTLINQIIRKERCILLQI